VKRLFGIAVVAVSLVVLALSGIASFPWGH
jgi:hypothetical protein